MNNRERLLRVSRDLRRVMADEAISPTPYDHLLHACEAVDAAAVFALDMNERDRQPRIWTGESVERVRV